MDSSKSKRGNLTTQTHVAQSPKCLVIAVYFGQLPPYFDVFLRSVQSNAEIDFLLVTDQKLGRHPSNLKVESSTLAEFQAHVSTALGMEVSMPRAYKICDFRPAFGRVFEDQARGYSYWGHCDLDVVFGDILGTIPEGAFDSRTKILIRGCFALYPNTSEANNWYRTVLPGVDYRRVFTTPNPFHFDESAGILAILRHLAVPTWNEECIFNIEWEHFRLRAAGSAHGYHSYVWRDGKVLEYSRVSRTEVVVREALLIHLMKRPMADLDFDAADTNEIFIGPDSFSITQESSSKSPERFIRLLWGGTKHQSRRLRRHLSKRGQLRPLA
jgi:hypothetical protein